MQNQVKVLHDHLTHLMNREILLSRELLSNLYEEEKALLNQDNLALQDILAKRFAPLEQLKSIRAERAVSMSELFQTVSATSANDRDIADAIIDDAEAESCEVFVLRDELIALIEKLNLQAVSNKHLLDHNWSSTQHANQRFAPWSEFDLDLIPRLAPKKKLSAISLMGEDEGPR